MTSTLGEVAELVRSKNAGPFWLTIDVFLANVDDYARVVGSPLTDAAFIADTYQVAADSVRIFTLPHLNAVKVSVPRPSVQGSLYDTDLHAGQQYVALLGTIID
ncbi:DUF4387 family protein [Subtercola lobariae]|uniref:DUF4387 domain-containing protein n=1 Tax=Subtercola lobariae TaxID=1588641 RepID=A0A917B7U1_9MICO|nr:DUF4387 family protein [Subtercola lobariae]GGF30572.1 hypothetical protein GCM10011399_24770 [Subtercola lobariae]